MPMAKALFKTMYMHTCGGTLRQLKWVKDARIKKDILVKRMTPQDISKAQDLARECVKKNYKDC